MPSIDFNFSGTILGAEINTVAVTATGTRLDVSQMTAEEVSAKLMSGEYSISLGDYLYDNNADAEIEMTDFEAGEPKEDPA